MFCPNCGNSISENADFCPNCGMQIQNLNNVQSNITFQNNVDVQNNNANQNNISVQNSTNSSQQTLSKQLAANNPLIPLFKKFKKFVQEHKKCFILGSSFALVIIIGLIVYGNLFSFSKLKWNKKYTSISLNYLTQGNIELGVVFSDEKNIDKLKFSSNCGEVLNNGLKINWDLTKNLGKCEITVKYKMKKISKEFNVIAFNGEQTELLLDYKIDNESDEDLDLDGLTNKEEKEYKTNPELFDSDMDGLDDKYEIFTSMTDPNNGNYVNLNKFTETKETSKKSVNSMKSKWNSNVNGTNIITALNNGLKEFTAGEESNYLILLTDGKNTEGDFSYSKSSIITSAKAKGVKVCVIGLGSDIDTSDLNEIAESSGCDYYNASGASALDEIYSMIGSHINYNLVDTDGNGKVDGTVIADSGFIVTRDGFSFVNYGTNLSSGGHCYGMATFAELYYTKKLPLSLGAKTADKNKSYSYNLNQTYFSDYLNLYDYSLKTNLLKYTFGFDAFGETTPSDFRGLKDNVLIINDKYKQDIINSKMFDITEEKTGLSKEKQLEKGGVNYKKTENILLNEDSMQNSIVIKDSDRQLINAIYASFIKQNVTTNYSSSSNFKLCLRI